MFLLKLKLSCIQGVWGKELKWQKLENVRWLFWFFLHNKLIYQVWNLRLINLSHTYIMHEMFESPAFLTNLSLRLEDNVFIIVLVQ